MITVTKFTAPNITIWCYPQDDYEFIVRDNKPLNVPVFRTNGDYMDTLYLRDEGVAACVTKCLDDGKFMAEGAKIDGIQSR